MLHKASVTRQLAKNAQWYRVVRVIQNAHAQGSNTAILFTNARQGPHIQHVLDKHGFHTQSNSNRDTIEIHWDDKTNIQEKLAQITPKTPITTTTTLPPHNCTPETLMLLTNQINEAISQARQGTSVHLIGETNINQAKDLLHKLDYQTKQYVTNTIMSELEIGLDITW